jgi:hypothetical protein
MEFFKRGVMKTLKIKIPKIIIACFLVANFLFISNVSAAPLISAYYLGTLPTDSASVQKLSKTDLLIVSPDQFIVRKSLFEELKKQNPDIIILAYVPSQSYNYQYWPDDLVYKNMTGIKSDWWLKDSSGNIVSSWPGIRNMNMDRGWSEYLVNFINANIASLPNVDGIFFDMVDDGISHTNSGDVVLSNFSSNDASAIDAEWVKRVQYLLSFAEANIKTKYFVINGSSNESYQKHINGRMYETFPTPWENGGNWSAIMTKLNRNVSENISPHLYIFNSNSNNTGKQNDYRKVRFGLTSSLLVDNVFFGYDYGDQNHAQLWWYDEYDAKLGNPIGGAVAMNGSGFFQPDVWRRDYSNGLALVNPTAENKSIDLGGEYEKLIGSQDKKINDGSIVDSVNLAPRDGILLYKTFQKINNAIYPNGSFLRFYNQNGSRARNGFFSYETDLPGGSKVYVGDLDVITGNEKIVITGPKLEIFNGNEERWFSGYPFGGNYKGELYVAVGRLNGDGTQSIVVAGSNIGFVNIYDFHGELIKEKFYPLGKNYKGGLSPAIVRYGNSSAIAFGTGSKMPAEVVIFDKDLKNIIKRFSPWGKYDKGILTVTSGDFNGDGKDELAVAKQQKNPRIRIFDLKGIRLNDFPITGIFGNQKIGLGAVSFTGEKKQVLMVVNKN